MMFCLLLHLRGDLNKFRNVGFLDAPYEHFYDLVKKM